MKMRSITRLTVFALSLVLVGCEGGSTEPDPPIETDDPVLEFDYSGDRTGSYRAEGDAELDSELVPLHGSWAVAYGGSGGEYTIQTSMARSAPLADLVILAFRNVSGTGTYPIQPGDVCESSSSGCVAVNFALGYDFDDPQSNREELDAFYSFISGSVTLSGVAGDELQGTFDAQALSLSGDTLTVTGGSFTVPIIDVSAVPSTQLLPFGVAGGWSPVGRSGSR